MQITKKHWIAAGIGFIIAVLLGLWWPRSAGAPIVTTDTSSTTPSAVSATTSDATVKPAAIKPFPLNAADTLVSWSFKGIYAGNDTLIQKANADITFLTNLLGKGKYDDYDLYNGIANDYGMLGDGTRAYQNFNRAIAVHPTKGLAFVNLANLMDQLGAYRTAADAFTKAVTVEPRMLDYHLARLTYLTRQFSTDNARIVSAFTDASKQFGDTASVLSIEAEWLTGQKRYADAIKAWETVKTLLMGKDTTAIDAAIAQLKAKQ